MLIDWTPVPQVDLELQVERLEAGPVLRNAGYASATFIGPLINLRF